MNVPPHILWVFACIIGPNTTVPVAVGDIWCPTVTGVSKEVNVLLTNLWQVKNWISPDRHSGCQIPIFFRAFPFCPVVQKFFFIFSYILGFVQSGHVYIFLQSRIVCYLVCLLSEIHFSDFLSLATPVLTSCALGKFLPLGCSGEISLIWA